MNTETVAKFVELFKGRSDCWGKVEGGCVKEKLQVDHYRKHLEGEISLGVYPLLDDGNVLFATIDIDNDDLEMVRKVAAELKAKGFSAYIERSKSKGYHIFLFFSVPVSAKDIREILSYACKKAGCEKYELFPKQDILTEKTPYGSYINLPYLGLTERRKFIDEKNDNIALEEFLETVQKNDKLCVETGLKQIPSSNDKPVSLNENKPSKEKQKKMPPCISKILNGVKEGCRDEAMFALAKYFNSMGWSCDLTLTQVKEVNKKNTPPEAESKIESIVNEVYKKNHTSFSCDKDLIKQFCSKECDFKNLVNVNGKKKVDGKVHYKAYFEGLVDLVEEGGSTAFAIKEGAGLRIAKEKEIDGVTYCPPPKDNIPLLLPRAEKVKEAIANDSDGKLYEDLYAHHKSISELPNELYYDLLVCWDFHTYLLEQFQYSPIMVLYAVAERGKSRTGKGMCYIAFRGVIVESLREAYLLRIANDLNCTLFFDVRDIWGKATANGSEDILLNRFEKGSVVPRVIYPEKGQFEDTVYYKIFGATVAATNEDIDNLLETRGVLIKMQEGQCRFENDVSPENCLALKERLVAFRFRHLNEKLPETQKIANGRLGDILRPLHQTMLLVNPCKENVLFGLSELLTKEKLLEKGSTIEGEILRKIISLEFQVEAGILPVKRITDALNEEKQDRYKFSYQRIGRKLDALGFSKAKTSTGSSAIVYDTEKVRLLSNKYGLQETSETPETPVRTINIEPEKIA